MVSKTLFSSERDDWNTPEEILTLVRELGPIGLDPCSNGSSIVSAALAYDKEANGLSRTWAGNGLVFVNPPYGRATKGAPGITPWISKCRDEATHGAEIVALVPARTDTKWFQEYGFTASRVLFYRGRVRFTISGSATAVGAPFPSAILYWGPNGPRFSMIFSSRGRILRPWPSIISEGIKNG